jgi:signal transduction histidine kinase
MSHRRRIAPLRGGTISSVSSKSGRMPFSFNGAMAMQQVFTHGNILLHIVPAQNILHGNTNNIDSYVSHKGQLVNNMLKKTWSVIRKIVEDYPVIVAALVIYLYYLFTSLNLFSHETEKRSFTDYFLQFDSLFFLWLAAAALIQLQRMRKNYKKEAMHRLEVERVLDRQQIYSGLIKDITMLLQDNVNNPLAIISVTTQEIRRKFESDAEIIRWLDRIDSAMKRIHNTIRDLQAYEAQKLIESSNELLKEQQKNHA